MKLCVSDERDQSLNHGEQQRASPATDACDDTKLKYGYHHSCGGVPKMGRGGLTVTSLVCFEKDLYEPLVDWTSERWVE
jgi:hypothetical protein